MTTDRQSPRRGSLHRPETTPTRGECFTQILSTLHVRIEQILSSASPDPTPYNQPHDEWVLLLDGGAVLEVDGEPVTLRPGDWLWLPAHTPHRVVRTLHATRWLAVHVDQT